MWKNHLRLLTGHCKLNKTYVQGPSHNVTITTDLAMKMRKQEYTFCVGSANLHSRECQKFVTFVGVLQHLWRKESRIDRTSGSKKDLLRLISYSNIMLI